RVRLDRRIDDPHRPVRDLDGERRARGGGSARRHRGNAHDGCTIRKPVAHHQQFTKLVAPAPVAITRFWRVFAASIDPDAIWFRWNESLSEGRGENGWGLIRRGGRRVGNRGRGRLRVGFGEVWAI